MYHQDNQVNFFQHINQICSFIKVKEDQHPKFVQKLENQKLSKPRFQKLIGVNIL